MFHHKFTDADEKRSRWAHQGRWATACLTTLFLFTSIAMLFPGSPGVGEQRQQIAALGHADMLPSG